MDRSSLRRTVIRLTLTAIVLLGSTALTAGQSPTPSCDSAGTGTGSGPFWENLLLNPSAETGDLSGWSVTPGFTVRSDDPDPPHGEYYFYPGLGSQHSIWQLVDLVAVGFGEDQLDAQTVWARVGGYQRSYPQTPSDLGQIVVEFLDAGLEGIEVFEGPVLGYRGNWERVDHLRPLPPGTRYIRFTFTATRRKGLLNDASLDAAVVSLEIDDTIGEDCNENGVADECDIATGWSTDLDGSGTPDECEYDDTDGDGILDPWDLCPGFDDAQDMDGDGLPDGCDACPQDPENDADGDGLCAEDDNCPYSDLEVTVVLNGCDTGVENILFETGCTLADVVDALAADARNTGLFISRVAHLVNELKGRGLLTPREASILVRCAARSRG